MKPEHIAPEGMQCRTPGHVAGADYFCQCEAGHTGYHAAEPGPGETVTWPFATDPMDTTRLQRPARVRSDRAVSKPPISNTPLPPLATTEQLAAYLHVEPGTIHHWRVRGVAPRATRVGGRLRFKWADVETWLDKRDGIA